MNSVLQYLQRNRTRLALDRFVPDAPLSAVVITPRFRASSHVVFAIFASQSERPVLFAKVPRLPHDDHRLRREATNLQAVEAAWASGATTVPRLVAFEPGVHGRTVLYETAVSGQTMSARAVRHQTAELVESVVNWTTELHLASRRIVQDKAAVHRRLVTDPLHQFLEIMSHRADERRLVEQTLRHLESLQVAEFPHVLEHGDLGPPNILRQRDGRIGVVDWELADPDGLPAADLFFFLTLIQFATSRATKARDCVSAFHDAFFGPAAWTKPFVSKYTTRLQLDRNVVAPLFLLTWARYVAQLAWRLRAAGGTLDAETADWIRNNRYYMLWQHTLANLDELAIAD